MKDFIFYTEIKGRVGKVKLKPAFWRCRGIRKNMRVWLQAVTGAVLVGLMATNASYAQQQGTANQVNPSGVAANDLSYDVGEEATNDAAFEAAMSGMLPMNPDQIREMLRRIDANQEAAQSPPHNPTPKVKVASVSLDPGAPLPEIKVSSGFVTTLTILDATGQPWPIKSLAYGGNFDISSPGTGAQIDPEGDDTRNASNSMAHVVHITPMARYGKGNLSLNLVGLSTPITFRLTSGTNEVHYRFDARIPEYGPNARLPLIDKGGLQAADPDIMQVLDGVPPQNAVRMNVSGIDRRSSAWQYNGMIYLRTPLKLLSPGWEASASSADGMTVYQLSEAPVLLLSDNGVTVRARLSPREGPNGQ